MSAVGRASGRIWRIQGTPVGTRPDGEVFADVRAAESASHLLPGATAAILDIFWRRGPPLQFRSLFSPRGGSSSLSATDQSNAAKAVAKLKRQQRALVRDQNAEMGRCQPDHEMSKP